MKVLFLVNVDSYRRGEELDLSPEIAQPYLQYNFAVETRVVKRAKESTPAPETPNRPKATKIQKPIEEAPPGDK